MRKRFPLLLLVLVVAAAGTYAYNRMGTTPLVLTGIVTTNVDGKWYVSPLRSFTDIELTVLKSLEAKDAYALVKLLK